MDSAESRRRREEMVRFQLESRGIRDPRVLDAMREIPREVFLPEGKEHDAYWDGALPIGHGQTISQPYIVALMTEALELKAEDKVLEVGTGSGYQAAILARLCRWVYTIERLGALSQPVGERLGWLGISNVTLLTGDGTLGYKEEAPYDGIIVTAAAPHMPRPLFEQLAEGGRLVIPEGGRSHQVLFQIRKREGQQERQRLCDCVFVPLVGQEGWEKA